MEDLLIPQVVRSLESGKSVEELVRRLLLMLEATTDLESTYLTKIDLQQGLQQILFSHNSKSMQIPEGLSVPWEDTLCKRALEEGRLCTDDVASCWGDSQAAKALNIVTYVSTPVRLEDGTLFGTLCAASSERKPISEKGANVLRLFSELIAQSIWRDQLLSQLRAANAAL